MIDVAAAHLLQQVVGRVHRAQMGQPMQADIASARRFSPVSASTMDQPVERLRPRGLLEHLQGCGRAIQAAAGHKPRPAR